MGKKGQGGSGTLKALVIIVVVIIIVIVFLRRGLEAGETVIDPATATQAQIACKAQAGLGDIGSTSYRDKDNDGYPDSCDNCISLKPERSIAYPDEDGGARTVKSDNKLDFDGDGMPDYCDKEFDNRGVADCYTISSLAPDKAKKKDGVCYYS